MTGRERVRAGAPCIFCGRTTRDMRMHYGNNEIVHWCRKVNASKGDIVLARDGQQYLCIADNKENDCGIFCLLVKYLSKEEWIEKQKLTNPNWRSNGTSKFKQRGNTRKIISVQESYESSYDPDELIEGEVEVLPDEKLDKIYRAFLNLLVLEDKHRDSLLNEWKSPVHDVRHLLNMYPIRSIPPVDNVRFSNNEHFKNPTRKHITSTLLKMFGDLKGVPGFYMRSGKYWDDKPENERWTFAGAEGIVFPCYDENGLLYRLRIKSDYYSLVLKEGKHHPFEGHYGTFSHSYDREGHHMWTFEPDGDDDLEPYVVYSTSIKKISLSKAGLPMMGKPSGKYKTLSSIYSKMDGEKEYNGMLNGCRSGSPYSIYTQPTDNYAVVLCTEGEKKAMVANAIKHFPTISVPGVSSYNSLFESKNNTDSLIDYLKKRGMKYFILCYDADKKDNETVAKAERSFIEVLKSAGITTKIGYWKMNFDKGLDDILLAGIDIILAPA